MDPKESLPEMMVIPRLPSSFIPQKLFFTSPIEETTEMEADQNNDCSGKCAWEDINETPSTNSVASGETLLKEGGREDEWGERDKG